MFDLFFLDYFELFIFGFRLSVRSESKPGDQKLLKDLCYSEGQFGHKGTVN